MISIRIGSKEAAAVKKLRASGENVSEILRQALLERANACESESLSDQEVRSRIDALHTEFPEPTSDYIAKGIDTTNREQMRKYMRNKTLHK
jgi:lipase chaperone LimK